MSLKCPNCEILGVKITSYGRFVRTSDKRIFRRYRCHFCTKTFSDTSFHSCYRQKKRRLNSKIQELLSSNMSQRRLARHLRCNRKTIARKLKFLGLDRKFKNTQALTKRGQIHDFEFDELETIEHTKCKPVSVIMAVEKSSRKILGFRVCRMPAKGRLAAISRKKYGKRIDGRVTARNALFRDLKPKIASGAVITSDQSPHYPGPVRKWFPDANHIRVKGQLGCVTGQGELKKIKYDPLFSLNHTFAMHRANINRLNRKTWCTTKDIECLALHIEIYVHTTTLFLQKS